MAPRPLPPPPQITKAMHLPIASGFSAIGHPPGPDLPNSDVQETLSFAPRSPLLGSAHFQHAHIHTYAHTEVLPALCVTAAPVTGIRVQGRCAAGNGDQCGIREAASVLADMSFHARANVLNHTYFVCRMWTCWQSTALPSHCAVAEHHLYMMQMPHWAKEV